MNIRKYLHITAWIIFFFMGVIEIIGFNHKLFNLAALAAVALLFGLTILQKQFVVPYPGILVLLTAVTVISGPLLNGTSLVSSFYFFRQLILLQYLYLVIIVNEKDNRIIITISRLILVLFALQIPASLVKLILIGPMESYIGTISIREGSLTVLITLIAISYLFAKYLTSKNKILLLYMFMFIVFSQIGEKRALILFLPVVLSAIYLYYVRMINVKAVLLIKRGSLFFVIGVSIVYMIVRMNPTLNPEQKVGGSFDLDYALDYINEYNQPRMNLVDYTRLQSMAYFVEYLFSQDFITIMFGEGAGKLSTATIKTGEDPVYYNYGIRYGGRMGIVWVLMQLGLIGSILYLYLLVKMLFFVLKLKPVSYHNLAFLGIWVAILLDLMTYSMVSIRFFVINGSFFYYFGVFYRDAVHGYKLLQD